MSILHQSMGREKGVHHWSNQCLLMLNCTMVECTFTVPYSTHLEASVNQLDSRHDVLHAVVDVAVSAGLGGRQDFMQVLQNTMSALRRCTTNHPDQKEPPQRHQAQKVPLLCSLKLTIYSDGFLIWIRYWLGLCCFVRRLPACNGQKPIANIYVSN